MRPFQSFSDGRSFDRRFSLRGAIRPSNCVAIDTPLERPDREAIKLSRYRSSANYSPKPNIPCNYQQARSWLCHICDRCILHTMWRLASTRRAC